MFISHGFLPSVIDQFEEGTVNGESLDSMCPLRYLKYLVELDNQDLHMHVKWHHAWSRRVVDPNAPPESVHPAYNAMPLNYSEDQEMDYI